MPNTQEKVLIIGAGGQIGLELTESLSKIYGNDNVIPSDLKETSGFDKNPYEKLDALDKNALFEIVKKHGITQVYHLAAMLSATGEQHPDFAWKLNMESLFHVLVLAKEKHIKQIYWPSSIAVFGPTTPTVDTPQYTVMEPSTIYGISKQAGERWCEWYFLKYGLDVRSLRYPGIISYKTEPGGGTTDYAVDIYFKAKQTGKYTCYIEENTLLPMMYMPDAIRATVQLMDAPAESIKVRSSYNLAAMTFSPKMVGAAIKKHIPDFELTYNVDFRQKIAETWPGSIDDSCARAEWGWNHDYDLDKMTTDMLENI